MYLVKDVAREGPKSMHVINQSRPFFIKLLKILPAVFDPHGQQGKGLSKYVRSTFEEYLKCGRLEHGFCEYVVQIVIVNIRW